MSAASASRPVLPLLGILLMLATGCGGGQGQSDAAQPSATQPMGSPPATGSSQRISRASVESCGGFTVAKAAEVLGVDAGKLADKSDWASWSDQQRECLFGDPNDISAPAVWFNLTIEDSPEEAASQMAQLREHAAVGEKALDAVTGETTTRISESEFAGIGDEAFWVGSTDALALRKGNVTAMVGVRGVDHGVEKTKLVGRELAAGLR